MGKTADAMRLSVLQKNQKLSFTIDAIRSYFKENSDEQMVYSGEILFSLSKGKKQKLKQKFYIDIAPYRKTLLYNSEELMAYRKIQDIPKKLDEIKKEIQNRHTPINSLPSLEI